MKVVKYKTEHMKQLTEQDATAWMATYFTDEQAESLEVHESYTGFIDGKVVACAGIVEFWKGRGEVWAILDKCCSEHFLLIHREVERFLDFCKTTRIEANVDFNFPQAHRWCRLLGFDLEAAHMPKYFPDGRDGSRYVRIR